MSDAAIISGSLVDVRNIGTDKCVKLTIHVSAELAMKVLNAFGWPTNVSPVAVAIARLNDQQGAGKPQPESSLTPTPAGAPAKSYAQRIALLCKERSFQKFMGEHFKYMVRWDETEEDVAAATIRDYCDVESRAGIREGTIAGNRWLMLLSAYLAWQEAPRAGAA